MRTELLTPVDAPPLLLHSRIGRDHLGSAGSSPRTRAIVLAGTHQWGDAPLRGLLRGPLLPVAQRPLIHYPLHWLRAGGVRAATICANSATREVRECLGDGASLAMMLDYFEDTEPRGPAGCMRDAGLASTAETFVVVEGALVPLVDLRALLATHTRSGAAVTVAVEIDRRRAESTRSQQRAPGGVYVFSRRVLESIAATGFQDIKEVLFGRLYQAGERVVTYETLGISPRVLSYDSYVSVSRWLIARAVREPELMDGYTAMGLGLCHPTAYVSTEATLVGPVLVGPGARIMDRAVVVGPTTIDAGGCVHAGALVSRSALWAGASVGEGAVVDASLVAMGGVVEPGERLVRGIRVSGRSAHPERAEPSLVSRRRTTSDVHAIGALPD